MKRTGKYQTHLGLQDVCSQLGRYAAYTRQADNTILNHWLTTQMDAELVLEKLGKIPRFPNHTCFSWQGETVKFGTRGCPESSWSSSRREKWKLSRLAVYPFSLEKGLTHFRCYSSICFKTANFLLTCGGYSDFQGHTAASFSEHCSGLISSFLDFLNQLPYRGTHLFGCFKSTNSITPNIWASLK